MAQANPFYSHPHAPRRPRQSLKKEPVGLDHHAAAIAAEYGDKGGIVITFSPGGVQIGAANLTPAELRRALCMAIHYSFVAEDTYVFEDKIDGVSADDDQ